MGKPKCGWCRLTITTGIQIDHLTFCSEACVVLYKDHCKRIKQECQGGIDLSLERIASLLKEEGHD